MISLGLCCVMLCGYQVKNQTNEILARYLAKHPLNKLKMDLCAFVADRKLSFGSSFLNQVRERRQVLKECKKLSFELNLNSLN